MRGCVYKITNRNTGRVYVGQTFIPFEERMKQHFRALRRGKHRNPRLQNSYGVHGADAFDCMILMDADVDDLTWLEQAFLDFYRAQPEGVYNGPGPVRSPRRGAKVSDDTRTRMCAAQQNRSPETLARMKAGQQNRSPEWLAKLSASGKKRRMSPEARAHLSAVNTGRRHTPEAKAKISAARKGKKYTDEERDRLYASRRGKRT